MTPLKVMVWNAQWMSDLFGPVDEPPVFLADDHRPVHTPKATVGRRRESLAAVVNDVAPDLLVLLEAPNRTGELELFFGNHVRGTWDVQVQHSPWQSQNVGLAIRTDQRKFRTPPYYHIDTTNLPAFDPFEMDSRRDETEEIVRFARRPIYAEIRPAEGQNFRLLGLHLKSAVVWGAYEWSRWRERAAVNRRKVHAQAIHLRVDFLDSYLEDEATSSIPLLVCGDINDGPGFEESEERIFGSAVERLMGSVWRARLCLGNALFDSLAPEDQTALDFSSIQTTSYADPLFDGVRHHVWVDHILYTHTDRTRWVSGGHVYRATQDGTPFEDAYPHGSDHFPVVATVTPPAET